MAIQLNDTHPALAVPELIRLLVDDHGLAWQRAWKITRETIHYTNHTLMPEALERWPVALLERLLPRHLQIIYEINAEILTSLRSQAGRGDPFLADVSVIEEGWGRFVRMGHLAFLGARRVNGVSALHTELMKQTVFKSLHSHFPDRIVNKTNGITPRRWLMGCNPGLPALLHEAIGDGWVEDLEKLQDLVPLADDAAFRERFATVKRRNKERLANLVARARRAGARPGGTVRRADQAHPRIQAPAVEPARGRGAVVGDPGRARGRLDAAGQTVRRQGRQQLLAGQAA